MNQQDIDIYETMGGSAPEPKPHKDPNDGFIKGLLVGMLCMAALVVAVWGGIQIKNSLVATVGSTEQDAGGSGSSGSSAEKTADKYGLLDSATVNKMTEIETLLNQYYLFDYEQADMQEGLIKGMVDALGDPYTVYYNEEETADLKTTTSGHYSGIGAVLTQNLNTMLITVTKVYKSAPAKEAGVKEGDIIYKVDGEDITGQEVSQVVTHIRGEEGTDVVLTVMRDGEELDITVTRRTVEVETVEYQMLENQTGYIEISGFEEVTLQQFQTALEDLKSRGMTSVIFDLRDNPGGLLDICCDMLDELLPEGLLVYTEDRSGNVKEYRSEGTDELGIPVAILINGNSASASEIFTGALKDRINATVIGSTSYGKGIVQSILDLGDGTSLKVTISEYFTPNGTEIHKIGITPDYEVTDNEETEDGEDLDEALDKALEVLGADR